MAVSLLPKPMSIDMFLAGQSWSHAPIIPIRHITAEPDDKAKGSRKHEAPNAPNKPEPSSKRLAQRSRFSQKWDLLHAASDRLHRRSDLAASSPQASSSRPAPTNKSVNIRNANRRARLGVWTG